MTEKNKRLAHTPSRGREGLGSGRTNGSKGLTGGGGTAMFSGTQSGMANVGTITVNRPRTKVPTPIATFSRVSSSVPLTVGCPRRCETPRKGSGLIYGYHLTMNPLRARLF